MKPIFSANLVVILVASLALGSGVNARDVHGLALGIVNGVDVKSLHGVWVNRDTQGLSIGLLNVARHLNGIQIGLLNYAGNNPKFLRLLPLVNAHLQ